MHSQQPDDPFKHLDGMQPFTLMLLHDRLEAKIRESILEHGKIVEEDRIVGWKWRSLWAMDSHELAAAMVRQMMNNRIRIGKEFDSVLDASRKHFAEAMLAKGMEAR